MLKSRPIKHTWSKLITSGFIQIAFAEARYHSKQVFPFNPKLHGGKHIHHTILYMNTPMEVGGYLNYLKLQEKSSSYPHLQVFESVVAIIF